MRNLYLWGAWVGIISLVFILITTVFSILEGFGLLPTSLNTLNVLVILLSYGTVAFVSYVFAALGKQARLPFLYTMSMIGIFWAIISGAYSIYALYEPALNSTVSIVGFLMLTGTFVILFGSSLLKLKKLGSLPKATGITYILTGVTLITFILAPVSILLSFTAATLEIILLFRAAKKYK